MRIAFDINRSLYLQFLSASGLSEACTEAELAAKMIALVTASIPRSMTAAN
jgi:hypothetical protein